MRSKKELEKEIQNMKNQISDTLKALNDRSGNMNELMSDKAKSDENVNWGLTLLKYLMEKDNKTYLILREMADRLERLESDLSAEYYEQDDQGYPQENNRLAKVQPLSGLDAKIMQIIQVNGMACAEDIKKQMSYRGRNAASARLNRLYRLGLLERHQLGHKVYYKYDAGKTTNTLIVSPPQ